MWIRRWMLGAVARVAACLTGVLMLALGLAATAQAYQAAPGWVASDYVTGFSFKSGAAGPVGLAFDGSGNLFMGATGSATLHKVPPGGGATAAATVLRRGYGSVTGLTFDNVGHLYMARGFDPAGRNDVVEVNPSDGSIIRTIASGFVCPVGLATDPISGDLFVSNVFCPGGGIFRISNFQKGPGVVTRYAGNQDADGITFAPDGTLYAAGAGRILRITGTNTSNPGTSDVVASVPTADGLAYAPVTATSPAFLVVARNDGQIDRVGLDGTVAPVVTGTSRGDLVTVGPDQCVYADLQDRVVKVGPAIGNCGFAPPVEPTSGGGSGGGSSGGGAGHTAAQLAVDMAVKATAPKHVKRGKRFTLSLKVLDMSRNMAHSPTVTDKLPKGATFAGKRSSKGVSCKLTAARRSVRCSMRSLAGSRSFAVKIVVRAMRGSRYMNSAEVRSMDLDSTPGNNKSRSRTRVLRA
jgi:Domain of unknown function DUF11